MWTLTSTRGHIRDPITHNITTFGGGLGRICGHIILTVWTEISSGLIEMPATQLTSSDPLEFHYEPKVILHSLTIKPGH